jgi:hypothetical protein
MISLHYTIDTVEAQLQVGPSGSIIIDAFSLWWWSPYRISWFVPLVSLKSAISLTPLYSSRSRDGVLEYVPVYPRSALLDKCTHDGASLDESINQSFYSEESEGVKEYRTHTN